MVQIFERPYFEMAYARKLFEPFQRLRSSSDYSGTGIGLATVKRIIRCHGSHVEGVNTVTEDCAKNLIAITQEIMGWLESMADNLLTDTDGVELAKGIYKLAGLAEQICRISVEQEQRYMQEIP
jgi:hypothetical protein